MEAPQRVPLLPAALPPQPGAAATNQMTAAWMRITVALQAMMGPLLAAAGTKRPHATRRRRQRHQQQPRQQQQQQKQKWQKPVRGALVRAVPQAGTEVARAGGEPSHLAPPGRQRRGK